MKMLFYVGVGLYLTAWGWLLLDCIRRREFYPVFGKGWGTKAFWLVTFFFFNPLLTLLYFVFGKLAGPRARPSILRSAIVVVPALAVIAFLLVPWKRAGSESVTLKRNPQTGEIVAEGGKGGSFEAHMGALESNNSLNTASSVMSSDHARFSCRRIWIVNESDHALMKRVAVEVQKQLSQLPAVDEVAYYPAGEKRPEGTLAPDVFVRLGASRIKETRLPLYHTLDAVIQVSMGTAPFSCSSHYTDHTTPPRIEYGWQSTLNHQSRMSGYESAGAKYKLAAADIAKQIAQSLGKQFKQWTEKYGALPPLPDSFYGTYHPAPKLAVLPGDGLDFVLSDRGLFYHTRTMWRYRDDRETSHALRPMIEDLKKDGWTEMSSSLAREDSAHVRMKKGDERLLAFRPSPQTMLNEVIIASTEKPKEKPLIVVQYEHLFSDAEREAALGDLLDSTAPVTALITFEKIFRQGRMNDQFIQKLENLPAGTAEEYVILAEVYQWRGEKEKARTSLMRARALQRMRDGTADLDGRIREVAKKLGDEKLAGAKMDPAVFEELGFIGADGTSATVEREVGLEEPVVVYRKTDPDHVVSLLVKKLPTAKNFPEHFELIHIETGDNSRSRSAMGSDVRPDGTWRMAQTLGRIKGNAEAQMIGKNRFLIRINLYE